MEKIFWGNSINDLSWFLGILIVGILFRHFISKGLSWLAYRLLKNYAKGQIGYEKFLLLLRKPFSSFIIIITVYFAFSQLSFPIHWKMASIEEWGARKILNKTFQTAILVSFTWIILRVVDFFGLILMYKASLTESKEDDQLVPFLKEGVKVIISIFALFFILGSVFDLNITSLIAGLGIGGLAIALAAKESIENLLGSFTIFLDKPFVVGDLIRIGNIEGNVEKIGFRSTRIRTLEKSFVTVPNKKLIDSELDNLSLREVRRVKFDIGLRYDSPIDKIKLIIEAIEKNISAHHLKFEKPYVYFYEMAASSINIRVIYFIDTQEFEPYIITRQEINFAILEIIAANGCSLAFPTQSIYFENSLIPESKD